MACAFFVAFASGEPCVVCFGCMVVFVGHQSRTKLVWKIYTQKNSIGAIKYFGELFFVLGDVVKLCRVEGMNA